MEAYTRAHEQNALEPKEIREVRCLQAIYPTLFRSVEKEDRIAGRLDFLPIGFGSVTSLGGVGHYCVFGKLREFQKSFDQEAQKRVDILYNYWLSNDIKTIYCSDILTDDTIGRFIDCEYPLIATARLSGMMLDYPKLLELGIGGLRAQITEKQKADKDNIFYQATLECLDLFVKCSCHLQEDIREKMVHAEKKRRAEL